MRVLISAAVLAILAVQLSEAEHLSQNIVENRQGRSLSSNSGSSNMIEHSSSKSKIELERRQVQEFLTTKNIFKSIVKLLFGSQEEVSATSRNVISILGKVSRALIYSRSYDTPRLSPTDNCYPSSVPQLLDLLKNTFGQKSRSGTARTIRDSAEDAANAGISMLQGYVKSVLTNDDRCVQKYLCQASKEATRDSRDLGYIIASVGGYATSYLLDSNKSSNIGFKNLYEASMKGRAMGEDCTKLYSDCAE